MYLFTLLNHNCFSRAWAVQEGDKGEKTGEWREKGREEGKEGAGGEEMEGWRIF